MPNQHLKNYEKLCINEIFDCIDAEFAFFFTEPHSAKELKRVATIFKLTFATRFSTITPV